MLPEFLLNYRNTTGSLGELELWKHFCWLDISCYSKLPLVLP